MIRKLSIQILHSLIFLQKQRIIHCDLKPENILLKQYGKSGIKVIDFGSSCFENEKLYTYIQSRFYRAPEIILGVGYGLEIDMWSFGCIIAELFKGIPIFPGENERDQIGYIMEYLGEPPKKILDASTKKSQFFDEENLPLLIPNSRGKIRHPNTKKLSKFLKGSDENFIDLIKKCFEWNPTKRIKPDEAILHPWITVGLTKEVLSFHKSNLKSRMANSINFNFNTEENQFTSSLNPDKRKASSKKLEQKEENFNTITNYTKNSKMLRSQNKKLSSSLKPKINVTLDININIKNKESKENKENKEKKLNATNFNYTTMNKTKPKISFC